MYALNFSAVCKVVEIMKNEVVYEVEKILDKRGRGRVAEYLIKWRNYGDQENTWEPVSNLKEAKEAIKKFNKVGKILLHYSHTIIYILLLEHFRTLYLLHFPTSDDLLLARKAIRKSQIMKVMWVFVFVFFMSCIVDIDSILNSEEDEKEKDNEGKEKKVKGAGNSFQCISIK